MRGLPIQIFVIILLIFIGLELISYFGLLYTFKDIQKKLKIRYRIIYWFITSCILASFIYLFSNPDSLSRSTDYRFFNFVLILIFINLGSKLVFSLFSIVTFFVSFVNRKTSYIISFSGIILTFGILLTMFSSVVFDKKQLRIEEVQVFIDSLPKQLDGFTMVQLSDVHLGSFNNNKAIIQKTQTIVNDLKPDLILFTGDMVNNFSYETEGYIDLFRKMNAPYGKFAITGNHDYGDYFQWKTEPERENNLSQIRQSIKDMGFELLLNENRRLQVKDTSFYIIGVENWGHDPFPKYADLDVATSEIPAGAFSVLMSHDPAHWDSQVRPGTDIALTLSGHTHGLQFGIKIAGIEFSPMFLIQKYWAGLYRKDNQFLYVNRGLGTVGFGGRIEMRPEISFLTLRCK